MNRQRHFFGLGILAIVLALGSLLYAHIVAAQQPALATPDLAIPSYVVKPSDTIISGDITTDTIWTKAGSPYLVTAYVSVVSGVTLTVDPGVEVRFDQYTGLEVDGTLEALGTASQPITFTSMSLTPTPGWWSGISFRYGTGALDYATIEYGGYNQSGNVDAYNSVVTVTHSLIRNGSQDGVHGWAGGLVHIADSRITGNAGYALNYADGSLDPQLSNLTVTGNGTNAIAFGVGELTGARLWKNLGIPYIMLGSQVVASDATLTVDPGVEVRFDQHTGLEVDGTLKALGATTQPITFTSTSLTPTPGWWSGISFRYGTGALDYVTIEYGGYNQPGTVDAYNSVVTVTHSLIRNGSQDGVHGWSGGLVHVADSRITGNAGYALNYADGSLDPQLSNLTVTDNGTNAIAFGPGDLTGARLWKNLGIPYIMLGTQVIESDATLTVDPGVQVRFDQHTRLEVAGTLKALGTASQPITFTSTSLTPTPGWWSGISFRYGTGVLDYVTIEYGGYNQSGNLDLYFGQASVSHSRLIYSSSAGLHSWSGGTGVSVEFSQIISNTGYGIWNNHPEDVLMAVDNWWGSASGPVADGNCNPGGTGSRVSAGVAYRPFLNAPNATPTPLTPREVYVLQASPSRWFVPADDTSPAWISITLRTGAGQLAPAHAVHVSTNLGTVASPDLTTNAAGQAFTYVTSDYTGTATIIVTSGSDPQSCTDWAVPASTQVSFTAAEDSPLMPNGAAPYLNDDLEVGPEPIIQGVPSTITLRLTNPFSNPITVEGTLGYLQFGIGQIFGPVKEVSGWVIPAHSEAELNVPWTPPLSGHYCLEFRYSYTGGMGALQMQGQKSGRAQKNLDAAPPTTLPPDQEDGINFAKLASALINDGTFLLSLVQDAAGGVAGFFGGLIPGEMFGNITGFIYEAGGAVNCAMAGGEDCGGWSGPSLSPPSPFETLGSLSNPSPRSDYNQPTGRPRIKLKDFPDLIAQAATEMTPGVSPEDIPPARLAVITTLVSTSLELHNNLYAAVLAQDRYLGAVQADDQEWSAYQASAFFYYKQEAGRSMIAAADAFDAAIKEIKTEGYVDIVVHASDIRAYQDRLRAQGFTANEIQTAHTLGLTDDGIAAALQRRLAVDPDQAAAGSLMIKWKNLASAYRALGGLFANQVIFAQQLPGMSLASAAAAGNNNLGQFFKAIYPFQVGNPSSQAATVELHMRRLDIPNDWIVSMDWISGTLAAGQQITATVTIIPASASVQGTQPKVAVEGYIGDQLIGGVVLSVVVPKYVAFKPYRVYLPLVIK